MKKKIKRVCLTGLVLILTTSMVACNKTPEEREREKINKQIERDLDLPVDDNVEVIKEKEYGEALYEIEGVKIEQDGDIFNVSGLGENISVPDNTSDVFVYLTNGEKIPATYKDGILRYILTDIEQKDFKPNSVQEVRKTYTDITDEIKGGKVSIPHDKPYKRYSTVLRNKDGYKEVVRFDRHISKESPEKDELTIKDKYLKLIKDGYKLELLLEEDQIIAGKGWKFGEVVGD